MGTDSGDGEVGPNGEGGRYYLAPDEAKARQYGETVIEVYANAAEGIQADGTVIVQGAEHIKAVENQYVRCGKSGNSVFAGGRGTYGSGRKRRFP